MAYDKSLADEMRELLSGEPAITERRMFGGLAFLLHGHMAVCASRDGGMLVRVDPADEAEGVVAGEHVGPMVMRGRPMAGWLRVAPAGLVGEDAVASWVERGVAYARTLPPKAGAP
ncbi:TfoX/Sxy family protein [Pseudonocardia sp.]|uniref:TfoX/Sxy family protein n=1 Tax=Pseudonocardia sp. TaxID=60912 RepID=UPI003D13F48A